MLAACASVVALVAPACSGENQLDPPQNTGGGGPDGGTTGPTGGCVDGDQQECHVTIGEHDGVVTCVDGAQTCAGGAWGQCEGVTRTRSAPAWFKGDGSGDGIGEAIGEGEYAKPLSLTDGGACDPPNPCDPRCQEYDEQPDGGYTIPGNTPPYNWTVGDPNTLPESIASLGINEPCTTLEDCQFDQFCDNPSKGACSHHPCASGSALLDTCSPCVQKICDINPTCCKDIYAGLCVHDPCTAPDSALKPGCDPCVDTVCAQRPQCCQPMCTSNAQCVSPSTCDTTIGRCTCGSAGGSCPTGATCVGNRCQPQWNAACKTIVTNTVAMGGCGRTCPLPNQWTAACAAMVGTECGAVCDQDTTFPYCAHDKCYTGGAMNAACDPCVNHICFNVDALCCTNWTQTCVDYVDSVCVPMGLSETCPPKGLCLPWSSVPEMGAPNGPTNYPNALCPGVDLTVGVTCNNTVPVCNRGSTAATGDVTVLSYAAGADEIPSSDPGEVLTSCVHPPGSVACSATNVTIPAGKCIDMNCPGLADGDELTVSFSGAECFCENNWSVYYGQACQSPACVSSVNVNQVKEVTFFVALDASTSMRQSLGSGTNDQLANRWLPATNALKIFFQDQQSAGINVAFRFWPDNNPAACSDSPCQPAGGGGCAVPLIAAAPLTAAPAPGDTQEAALIAAINAKTASGDTPMYSALDGATSWAINRKIANPDEEVAVIFITDGIPTHCNTDNLAIAGLASNAFDNYAVRTHVIGFGNASASFIEQLAAYGGGSASHFTSIGGPLESALVKALQSIRGDLLSCDITIPLGSMTNPMDIVVEYESSSGTVTPLTQQPGAASCGSGYYILPGNTTAKLCPSTCAMIQADIGAKVRVTTPCASNLDPLTFTEVYHGACPPGAKVQWGYLAYDTTAPSDTTVEWSVRSANLEADLPSATWTTVATSRSTPTDTQVCDMVGPSPCPIDLYNELNGLPLARHDYLELRMILNPSSDELSAPTVHDWEITYSCPDSE